MQNFFRLFMFLNEVAGNVIRRFLEDKCKTSDFRKFLKDNRHTLYHLYEAPRLRCCEQNCNPEAFPRYPVLRKEQFDQLFLKQRQGCRPPCSCCYESPTIEIGDIDMTLCFALINNIYGQYNCCKNQPLTPPEDLSLNDIRTVRNRLAHFSHNKDLSDAEFKTLWKTLKKAVTTLGCPDEYKEVIRKIKNQPILDTQEWMRVNGQNIEELKNGIFEELKVSVREHVTEEMSKVQDRLLDKMKQNMHEMNLTRNIMIDSADRDTAEEACSETTPKIISEGPDEEHDECEPSYFKLFNDIDQLRHNGESDSKDAVLYAVLVYIVLHGNSSGINSETLGQILNVLYNHSEINIPVQCSLEELVQSKYLEQVEDNFTTRKVDIDKAVIWSFGNVCSEFFVEHCNFDKLLEYVRPNSGELKDFDLGVDVYTLVLVLVRRMQHSSDAFYVAVYVRNLIFDLKDLETAALFLDTLEQCYQSITAEQLVFLLDGFTSNGTNFKVFDLLERLFNTFCQQIDRFGNTIFHYIVTKFSEAERYNLYIEYFCEYKIQVMQLENIDGHTPIDFASYLGRCEVVANVLCHTESSERVISAILTMVIAGLDFLQILNSADSEASSLLRIGIDKITFGEIEDYNGILEIVGEKTALSGECSNMENDDGHTDNHEASNEKESSDDEEESEDIAKTLGKGILNLVTDIKKGLNAFTKIPNIVKTIHQATNLDKNRTSEDKK